MKSSLLTLIGLVAMVVTLHAFRAMQRPGTTEKIIPWNGNTQVWAINGNRLVRVTPASGMFKFAVQQGTWKIFVDANTPYQDYLQVPVSMKEDKRLDLGEIVIQ